MVFDTSDVDEKVAVLNEYSAESLQKRDDLHIVSFRNAKGEHEYIYVNNNQIDIIQTILQGKVKTFIINNEEYEYFRTGFDDYNCMFYSLSFVLSHWNDLSAKQYRNYIEVRKLICDKMSEIKMHGSLN